MPSCTTWPRPLRSSCWSAAAASLRRSAAAVARLSGSRPSSIPPSTGSSASAGTRPRTRRQRRQRGFRSLPRRARAARTFSSPSGLRRWLGPLAPSSAGEPKTATTATTATGPAGCTVAGTCLSDLRCGTVCSSAGGEPPANSPLRGGRRTRPKAGFACEVPTRRQICCCQAFIGLCGRSFSAHRGTSVGSPGLGSRPRAAACGRDQLALPAQRLPSASLQYQRVLPAQRPLSARRRQPSYQLELLQA
mmetsp:Transcript_30168/g.76287  ORF Transcript_30168/g.76287 Transcript_30168/m.76287 type:complete len:248 (-) Transcript_30168:3332-4075(-)